MCIRHVQFFECPSRDGVPKRHSIKSNILCSNHFPCPDAHWEYRTSEYTQMCPGCSGEPPEVPSQRPQRDAWDRDMAMDNVWANNYIEGLANAVSAWDWARHFSQSDMSSIKRVTELYPTFFLERRCKENAHRPSRCHCEAAGPLAYLYNPAAAARRHFTDQASARFEANAQVQSEFARQIFAEIHRNLAAQCTGSNVYFTDGIARQPFFSTEAVMRRQATIDEIVGKAFKTVNDELLESAAANGAKWTDAHTLMESKAYRRKGLVQFMCQIAVYDNGFSMARFCIVVEKLARIIQTPQWRRSSGVVALEKLANAVSFPPSDANVAGYGTGTGFEELIWEAMAFFTGKREVWAREIRNYTAKRLVFQQSVEDVTDAELQALVRNNGVQEECVICYADYWERRSEKEVPPAVSSPTAAERPRLRPRRRLSAQESNLSNLSNISNQIRRLKWDDDPNVQLRIFGASTAGWTVLDRGEQPVRIKHCGHIFGRSCLFRTWVTEANDPDLRPTCPMCRAEPPDGVIRMMEGFLGPLMTRGAAWGLPTSLLSLVRRQ
ncbi:unnamed protein product [Colletotrichum noveboracense]|uniref:RING-type domain-containing protein n=1 Tax=Colletotrichum noveboracense TaxID=2664923 RepID=A0A9W4RLY5_9PEZI|nr:hypothetical protein CBS470a_001140 [Colletotrichum nupharicola]KAJ0308453.1 hypothetical protein Brms1b_009593 [Colletotrichum noveboracense]CAI0643054.1 unnamed protein product [Colletotrichum noveboracense]